MAYKKEDLEKQALDVIDKHKLFFIDDIVSYLPCSRSTFYEKQLDKSDSIKEALEKVKTDIKVSMRSKWYQSKNPLLQMALYKIIGTEDEYLRIASAKQEIKNTIIEKPLFNSINLDVPQDNSTNKDS